MKHLTLIPIAICLTMLSSIAEDTTGNPSTESKPKILSNNVKAVDKDIWVAIAYKFGYDTSEMVTLLNKDIYNQIISGKTNKGWLELKNVYWAEEEGLVSQKIAAKKWGYDKNTIIKVEDIHRIIPLSKEAIIALDKSKN